MSTPSDDDRAAPAQRQVPRNRFRVVVIAVVALIILVIFGYMLLVGARG